MATKDPGFIADCLHIGSPSEVDGEREIRVGKAIAYGTVAADGTAYALLHAPTQADFDAVATILDAAEPADIRWSLARG